MNILSSIIYELGKPDDQGKDWYGWASNQCAHAFLGVVTAVLFGFWVALALACTKELADIFRKPMNVVDSMTDVAFWSMGAWLVYADDRILVTILVVFALICGVIPRLRKVKNEA